MPPTADWLRYAYISCCNKLAITRSYVGGLSAGRAATVLIGKLPAAVMGDSCVCVGPPDTIIKGSSTVMICE